MRWFMDECESSHVDYQRHGGAYDRGRSDSYYGRGENPHYYRGSVAHSERVDIPEDQKDSNVYKAYMAGYNQNEKDEFFKDWGDK
mgnify:CR=1 FL=1